MSRIYTHIGKIEKDILEMRANGKSRREIWQHFGISKKQYENFLNRYNRKQKQFLQGILPKRRGRPPNGYVDTELEKDNEIKRLRMENNLLRDFLYTAGRR